MSALRKKKLKSKSLSHEGWHPRSTSTSGAGSGASHPINNKLDRSNYLFWKTQILPAARAHDLVAFFLGTKSKPNEVIADSINPVVSINNPEYVSWMRIDQFVMSWLLSSIYEQMLCHVIHCQSSA